MNDTTFAHQMVAAVLAATCMVDSFDLLLPLAGESTGLTEHAVNADKLLKPSMLEGLLGRELKLEDFNWYLNFYKVHEVGLHLGASVGMSRIAQFPLGQKDIRDFIPLLINRDYVT
ncbi:hypothetical protein DNI29_02415 [Hymenobacter sediminis]|uniref:amino acid--tRNA ligase-related protein n=1 Tax=Hymenobacter sediminis TaxID=2218621 RepID=UPI000DA68E1D|nr:amino acid--tRNA ligase-related protein [Hymenobacter sediminis]RPD49675.1 hypothetical protein DNI29_02415 [Hymenobacter sediminis]